MNILKLASIFAVLAALVVLSFTVRAALGRERPDLAAWASFDDGLWAFKKSYKNGSVGPFTIGDTRAKVKLRLNQYDLLEQDQDQLVHDGNRWRLSLPAENGGYVTYIVDFDGDKIVMVTPYYSVFAGL